MVLFYYLQHKEFWYIFEGSKEELVLQLKPQAWAQCNEWLHLPPSNQICQGAGIASIEDTKIIFSLSKRVIKMNTGISLHSQIKRFSQKMFFSVFPLPQVSKFLQKDRETASSMLMTSQKTTLLE